MRFLLRNRVEDRLQQENNDDLLKGLNSIADLLYFGSGVPAFTPTDVKGNTARALYIRVDGGAGTTLYVYEGAAWAAK